MRIEILKSIEKLIYIVFGIQYHKLVKDRSGNVSVRPSLHYRGFRGRVQHFAIGLGWMGKGGPYDDRTIVQRFRSGWSHIRFAFTGRFHPAAITTGDWQ